MNPQIETGVKAKSMHCRTGREAFSADRGYKRKIKEREDRSVMDMEERIKIVKGSMPLTDDIEGVLEKAAAGKIESVEIGAPEPKEKNSDMFSDATRIENIVVGFLKKNEFPKTVNIYCESDLEVELYMMAYNYWYATEKSERINDGRWD
jgi:hypothetical protein